MDKSADITPFPSSFNLLDSSIKIKFKTTLNFKFYDSSAIRPIFSTIIARFQQNLTPENFNIKKIIYLSQTI